METTPVCNSRIIVFATFMGIALSTTLFVGKTQAQVPGQNPGQNQGAGRSGRGGFAGQRPFTLGTIISGNASAGTITITAQNGNTQIIHVGQDTKIYSQTTIKASDLKVGDKLQVSGVPTGITAAYISAGEMPDFLPGAGRGRIGRGGYNGVPGPAGGQAANPGATNTQGASPQTPPPANASATGMVVGLKPLMIRLSDDVMVVLKVKENAKLMRIAELPYSKLKAGDRLMASGQTNADGSFNATGIGINISATGGRGMGGFGSGGYYGGGAFGPGGGRGGRRGGGPAGGVGGN